MMEGILVAAVTVTVVNRFEEYHRKGIFLIVYGHDGDEPSQICSRALVCHSVPP